MDKVNIKLSPENVDQLKAMQRRIGELLPVLDQAADCGIDCQQRRQQLAREMERATKLLDNFQ